ncbi:MAG: putative electron transport protein YccM [Pelotomaculum sp. PtaB.Bin104]|nr:MAG: putative electron transport protein YccM [Pelotomaculum sp. PtaB.Bin104]
MADLRRKVVQFASAIIFNSYAEGFAKGTIYRGNLKQVCLPVLNCYSCPGAIGSCPVGSLQAVSAGITYQFSFYVAGFLALVGLVAGRMACGWLCPFGLLQDLLYRVPSFKRSLPLWTGCFKYAVLVFLVLLLPALAVDQFGLGTPTFCKWLCPAGTLEAALPLAVANEGIRGALGGLFYWRFSWLLLILFLCIIFKRLFCLTLCPLGAVYSLFNRISIFSIRVDQELCTYCGRCAAACHLRLPEIAGPNHPECIRCLKCVKQCPTGAMDWQIEVPGKKEESKYA